MEVEVAPGELFSTLGWDRCEKKTKRSGLFRRKSVEQNFQGVDMDKLRSSHWWLSCHVLISPNPDTPPSFHGVNCHRSCGKLQTLKQKWNYFLIQTINCMKWQSNVPFLPCQVGVLILNWQFFNINWIYYISWWRENIKTWYEANSSVMSFWRI